MSTLTHPLAVGPNGRDLFTPEVWRSLPSGSPVAVAEPSTPAGLLPLLATHDAVLGEALDAMAAADEALDAATDEALGIVEAHAESRSAWSASAVSGASKAPKAFDLDAAAFRLVALMRDRDAALSAGIRAARAVDAAVPGAVRSLPADVRAGLVDRLRQEHAAAVEAVSAAFLAVAVLDDARLSLALVDSATLAALGVPASAVPTVMGDRLPRPSSSTTMPLNVLTAEAVEALAAPISAAVEAYRESQRPRTLYRGLVSRPLGA